MKELKETLEEAAETNSEKHHYAFGQQSEFYQLGFIEGAKWQQERMYSLDEIKDAMKNSYGLKYFSEHKFLKNLNNLKRKHNDI